LNTPEGTTIGPLARSDGGPLFDEPWQAQVLALASLLLGEGVFTPVEWADTLGTELLRAADSGAADDQRTYYASVLAALERLVAADGRVTPDGLSLRTEQWRRAYLNTPHGHPVALSAESRV
jgi:nitrile hydratase accessory protein